MQAANTGLTGGSTPLSKYERDAIVVSTLRIDSIVAIRGGEQVVCYAGSTLQSLEQKLEPLGRLPHSVLGSSCIGASVVGGVCNNSGGALINRGPAYTELSVFARLDEHGELALVNHLGIELGNHPDEILRRLDEADFDADSVHASDRLASDLEYSSRIRDITSAEPSRFNGDPRRQFESSGSAGKLAVFAVRLDTFPAYRDEQTFFVSTNDPGSFASLRRSILAESNTLPLSAEYIHRDALKLAREYGNDTVWFMDKLGANRIASLFRVRCGIESLLGRMGGRRINIVDRVLQLLGRLLPSACPAWLGASIRKFEHHLILKTYDSGIEEAKNLLEDLRIADRVQTHVCAPREGELVSLLRFAAAGAAIRYEAVHSSEASGIVALDIALPRNTLDWLEELPSSLEKKLLLKSYYGHFLCHVLHQDYVVRLGVDCDEVRSELLTLVELRGAKYPAEHNFGHAYDAPTSTKNFYEACDPTNTFNPGVGGMSKKKHYR